MVLTVSRVVMKMKLMKMVCCTRLRYLLVDPWFVLLPSGFGGLGIEVVRRVV